MSKEYRSVEFGFTVNSPDNLPKLPNGEQMYADDVVAIIYDMLEERLSEWYYAEGRDLLACRPV